jgi:hypothetical protein
MIKKVLSKWSQDTDNHHLSPSFILSIVGSMLTHSIMTQSIMPISISDSHHDDTQSIVVLCIAMPRVVILSLLSVTLLSTYYSNICGQA